MATSLNVTVAVPLTLRSAVEGRPQLILGFPPTADLGDVLEALLRLYPKLLDRIANERLATPGLNLFLDSLSGGETTRSALLLKEGLRLYLSAAVPKRL